MKRAGLFILESGPFLRECEWLRRRTAEAVPGLPAPCAVAAETLPQLLEALAAQIKHFDLFVVAAEPRWFHDMKAQLLEALGLPAQVREDIAALQRKYPEDTMFPSGASLFVTREARYNGFAMRCGRQHMLVLPLRMDLLESMETKIAQYLRSASGARVIPMHPARSVDALLTQMGGQYVNAPISPESIVPLALWRGTQAPAPQPVQAAQAASASGRTWGRRARQAAAAGMAVLMAAGGLFAGARQVRGGELEMSLSQFRIGDPVRLDSALLNDAVLIDSQPTTVAALLLEELEDFDLDNPVSEEPEVFAEEQEETPDLQAAPAPAAVPVSINPLDSMYKLSLGGVLRSLLDWLLGLLSYIPDVPTTQATTTTAMQSTDSHTTTTTAKQTTTTTTTTASKPAAQGVFSFTVVGFGHGVGLSQYGARALGAQGWDCERILKHYYNAAGIAISSDAGRPGSVTHGGVSYELKEYLARVAYAEIGRSGLVADEAIKAQMICAYTISKANGFKTTDVNQKIMPDAEWNSNFAKQFHAPMLALAASVLGKHVTYNGQTAQTLYFASCGGYTASAQYAWGGGTPPPYLTGGVVSPETVDRSYPSFTTDQIKEFVKAYNAKYPSKPITLGADASQWIKVLRADAHGYVEQLQIGDRVLTGGEARNNFFGAREVRSHNFTVSFTGK